MYEALIARIRYHIQKANFMGLKEAESTLLLAEAADAIEKLCGLCASQSKDCSEAVAKYIELWVKQPRWVPVTERLPKEDGKYLTVYWLGTIPKNTPWIETAWFAKNLRNVDKYDFPKKKSGFYVSDSEYGYYEITGVTHWMPLPEPPKEGKT